jgi:hypothetical protein
MLGGSVSIFLSFMVGCDEGCEERDIEDILLRNDEGCDEGGIEDISVGNDEG